MNATNLYVTTSKVFINSDLSNPKSWKDLYRLLPYLRNSLCCVVCLNLLVDPYTPNSMLCQHHVCRLCREGRKKLKPACIHCKGCEYYVKNKRLKVMMQMYKKMCALLMKSALFENISNQAMQTNLLFSEAAKNVMQVIKEGATFQDLYESQGGLPKETYSILPFVHTKSSVLSNLPLSNNISTKQEHLESTKPFGESSSSSSNIMYSVVYPGTGNKITIKRKSKEQAVVKSKHDQLIPEDLCSPNALFKRPVKSKKGCRCGNATVNPGKLTCCGQRCPCYVQGGPCVECKCRGCRNPHRLDGLKVIPCVMTPPLAVLPEIPEIQSKPLQTMSCATTSPNPHLEQKFLESISPITNLSQDVEKLTHNLSIPGSLLPPLDPR